MSNCFGREDEMTEKEQIQNQIQELQEKLKKLEEVENEKMEFKDEGRFHFFIITVNLINVWNILSSLMSRGLRV
jgi:hypothetical protein